ncbi:MAG: hypothetical protein JWN46_287 [Acidimicrobiales bacterium]|nr:hypothetical protein [Acidimicrobiales bacterium]
MPWSALPDPDDHGPAPRPLPDVLDQVLAGLGAPSVDVLMTLHERWSDLVGAEVAEHAQPISIEHGRLLVTVDNAAWASHLRWAEAELLTGFERLLGRGVVTAVRTRVGSR